MKATDKGQSSHSSRKCEVWTKLWKIQIPNAMRMMLWRACHDSLPTKQNLFKRKMVESSLCPICTLAVESTTHALWSCPSVQDVWGSSSKKLQKVSIMETSFQELVTNLISVLSAEELAMFAATVY